MPVFPKKQGIADTTAPLSRASVSKAALDPSAFDFYTVFHIFLCKEFTFSNSLAGTYTVAPRSDKGYHSASCDCQWECLWGGGRKVVL